MTAKQLTRKLTTAGFDTDTFETSRDQVELAVLDYDGDVDYDRTEKLLDEMMALLGWGGHRTGWGSWILRPGFVADDADYCDRSSRHHY